MLYNTSFIQVSFFFASASANSLDARLITSTRIQFTFCHGWLFAVCRAFMPFDAHGHLVRLRLFHVSELALFCISGQVVFIRRHEERPYMCGGSIFFTAKQPSVSPSNLGREHCLNFFHKFGTP